MIDNRRHIMNYSEVRICQFNKHTEKIAYRDWMEIDEFSVGELADGLKELNQLYPELEYYLEYR